MRNILAWALAVEVLGLAVLPALRAFFGNRRDAALLSRPVGLALTGWFAWALSLVLPFGFSRATILLSVGLLAGLTFVSTRRAGERAGGPFWGREENRGALYFWVPAAVFLLVRAAVPEILGAEKFMDLAFFNSLTRRPEMPPIDPWMSGHTINYYYWGYLLAAVIAKTAGVSPFVGYNLAVATFAGYSFAAAACLAFRLSGGRKPAAIGAGFVSVFAGNLTGALDVWAKPFAKDFDYWHASRVIGSGDTINEFPFFTFFHADLHPHLLAFPFFLAAFAFADRWIEAGPAAREHKPAFDSLLHRAAPLLLVSLLVAVAIAANPWNGPALALLLVFAGALRTTRGEGLPRLGSAVVGAFTGLGIILAALLLTQPYRASYRLPYNGVGRTHAVSGFLEFLGVWGLLLAVAIVGLLAPDSDQGEVERRRRDFSLALAGALSVAIAFSRRTPALLPILLLGFLAGSAGWRALRRERDRGLGFAAFLCLLALAMIAGCEFVYFKDSYGDKLHRMNTVFKFYHQAWPLLGIGAVVFAEHAWRTTKASRAVAVALAAIVFLSLLYPLATTVSRLRQKNAPFSLDARGALGRRDAGDLEAIAWLEKNASRTSILMEASGDPYREYARISSHTGIPTVLGWANHEGLWRSNDSEVAKRLEAIRLFYTSGDPRSAREILDRYRVTHVVLGNLERSTYSSGGVASFPFLQPVHPGNTTVYAVAR